ncbi:MAG: glycosyltransferase family 9 protein [Myxococcota bacterium]|nr:glycosyltransferase family 9 protein [Myxococcota bacterium]
METEKHLAVLRLGRLGDLVMVEPALRWAAACPGLRVTLVTEPHYAEVFAGLFRGVAVQTQVPQCDLVLDLHRVAASRKLRRGHPWLGVGKEDLRRRLTVHAPGLGLRPRSTWPERHLLAMARAFEFLGLRPGPRPAPRPRFDHPGERLPNRLGLCLGAGWANKRWPGSRWEELAGQWRGEVVAFVGPGEEELAQAAGLTPWSDLSLGALVDGLASCSVVVGGDTGPLHLAGALGCRVVGLFGPTSPETGFWVWGAQGKALQAQDVRCSPCSLHGSDRCPRGHHRCLAELDSQQVLEALH